MISSAHPYEARYRIVQPDGSTYFTLKPVIAWAEDGDALVVDHKTGRLRTADSFSNFDGVRPADSPVVGVLPGADWRAEYREDDDTTFSMPLLAWLVRANGQCDPLAPDSDGVADDPTTVSNFARIYRTGEAEGHPLGPAAAADS